MPASSPFDHFRRSAHSRGAAAEAAALAPRLDPGNPRELEEARLAADAGDDERFPELAWIERMLEEPRPGYPRDRREARLLEHLARSLERKDSLRANAGGANADVMWLAQKVAGYAERWQPELNGGGFETLRELVATLGNLHGQLTKLTTLEARLGETARSHREARGSS